MSRGETVPQATTASGAQGTYQSTPPEASRNTHGMQGASNHGIVINQNISRVSVPVYVCLL